MLAKVKAFYTLFKKGKCVGNPATWKKRQVGVNAVHGLLWAGLTAYAVVTGMEIPIPEEAVEGISLALVTAVPALAELFNIISTIITTDKVGVKEGP